MARRLADQAWRDRIGDRADPGVADLLERFVETDAVDFAARCQAGHQHGHLETSAFRVDRLGEQECFALRLGNTTPVLPTHQWVHFRVFVDRLVDDDEQACLGKREHVFVQIAIAARISWRRFAVAGEHA